MTSRNRMSDTTDARNKHTDVSVDTKLITNMFLFKYLFIVQFGSTVVYGFYTLHLIGPTDI